MNSQCWCLFDIGFILNTQRIKDEKFYYSF